MSDIYSWNLSPEIREYLRGNYRSGLMERQALLEKAVKVYQPAIQEIHRCRQGEFYFYRTGLQFGGGSSLFAFPFGNLTMATEKMHRTYSGASFYRFWAKA